MKFIKKLTVFTLIFLMVLSISACSGLKVVKEIASVDGNLISKAEYLYYLENIKSQMLMEAGISAGTEEAKSFWEAGEIDGQNAGDVAKNKAMEECVRTEIATILAKEKGFSISSELKSMMKETVKAGGEQIDLIKDITGLSDDLLVTVFEKSEYANMYAQDLFADEEKKLVPAEEDIQKKYADEYIRVKHVLISNTPEGEQAAEEGFSLEDFKSSQKLLAADVMQKAKDGEDFDKLIADFNTDPGMETSPDGYTFAKNSGMVAEFEKAAFELGVGEVSDIVETSFGWHIIKRYDLLKSGTDYDQAISTVTSQLSSALYNEYIDSLKGNYTIEIKEGTLDSIKLK